MDDMRGRLLDRFSDICGERLGTLEDCMMDLEGNPFDERLVERVYAELHALKGEARMLGLRGLHSVAHQLEDLMISAVNHAMVDHPQLIDVALVGVDIMKAMVQEGLQDVGETLRSKADQYVKATPLWFASIRENSVHAEELDDSSDAESHETSEPLHIDEGTLDKSLPEAAPDFGLPEAIDPHQLQVEIGAALEQDVESPTEIVTPVGEPEAPQANMDKVDPTRRKLVGRFGEVARQRIADIQEQLAALQELPSAPVLRDICLELQSLKVEARFLELESVSDIVSLMELLIFWLRDHDFQEPGQAFDGVQVGLTLLVDIVQSGIDPIPLAMMGTVEDYCHGVGDWLREHSSEEDLLPPEEDEFPDEPTSEVTVVSAAPVEPLPIIQPFGEASFVAQPVPAEEESTESGLEVTSAPEEEGVIAPAETVEQDPQAEVEFKAAQGLPEQVETSVAAVFTEPGIDSSDGSKAPLLEDSVEELDFTPLPLDPVMFLPEFDDPGDETEEQAVDETEELGGDETEEQSVPAVDLSSAIRDRLSDEEGSTPVEEVQLSPAPAPSPRTFRLTRTQIRAVQEKWAQSLIPPPAAVEVPEPGLSADLIHAFTQVGGDLLADNARIELRAEEASQLTKACVDAVDRASLGIKTARTPEEIAQVVAELVSARRQVKDLQAKMVAMREDAFANRRRLGALQDQIGVLREVPIGKLFELLCQVIRRVRATDVEVECVGSDVLVDRSLVESLEEPLMHWVGERSSLLPISQPHHIQLAASRAGDALHLSLSLNGGECTQVLPDLLRGRVASLGGTVRCFPGEERGETLSVKLPRSRGLQRVLMLRIPEGAYSVPLAMVEEVLEIWPSTIRGTDEGESLVVGDGESVQLVGLGSLLHFGEEDYLGTGSIAVVLLSFGGARLALRVTEVQGERRIHQVPPSPFLRGVEVLSGTAVLEDGSVGLCLNVHSLMTLAQRNPLPEMKPSRAADGEAPPVR